ncbi:MAG: DUF4097 family beta strand repeat-containing protein [Terracidiphilus sp.]
MSSVPPNTPPGAPPPYDPHTQWRIYREQQRAAWRAQRDQWRAQRHAWKAGMVGAYMPRVPSIVGPVILIAVGIIAMLIYAGSINAGSFWDWYGKWWPLLLILAGVAMLGEWAVDAKRTAPVRRGGSFVGLLILLAVIGVFAAWGHQNWDWMRNGFGDNDSFWNALGRPQHDLDQTVLNAQIPLNGVVNIDDPRGDLSITAADGQAVQVQAHEIAYADSDDAVKKIFNAEAAHVTVSGNTVMVKSEGQSDGRLNLTVIVPRSALVTVNAGHGDVTAAGLGAGANLTVGHGDIHLNTITGSVQVHFATDKGDFSAHQVTGDITADGRCNDVTLSEVKGKIAVNGDIFGEVHMESLSGPVHLHTSVTDVQFGALPGDMTMDQEDLRVTEAKGTVRVMTHSKNVDLSQIYGDTYVEDRDADISIAPAGAYSIQATSSSGNGNLDITLPPDASATIDGRTHNGDIVSDYPLDITGDESKTVTGRIGGGAAKISVSTEVGDVRITKGTGFPSEAETPAAPEAPPVPPANAKHLKPPKKPPVPVTQ